LTVIWEFSFIGKAALAKQMSPSLLSNSATNLCIDLCGCWTFVHTLIGFSLPGRLEKEHGKVNALPCVHFVPLKKTY